MSPRANVAWLGLTALLLIGSCRAEDPVTTIDVVLSPGQVYEYPTVGGDEDGARIVTQARHFALSEFRRDASTNWVAVYVYQPEAGYSGADGAEIEVLSGSDGASPPKHVARVVFRFAIQE